MVPETEKGRLLSSLTKGCTATTLVTPVPEAGYGVRGPNRIPGWHGCAARLGWKVKVGDDFFVASAVDAR